MVTDYFILNPLLPEPLYQQLYCAVRRAVEDGHLPENTKMPSIRRLSEELNISRTTVEGAYQQLCVEGVLKARPQSGYYIQGAQEKKTLPYQTMAPSLSLAPAVHYRYDFGTGFIDQESCDRKLWQRHIRNILNRPEIIVSYGDPQGEPELRQALSAYSYSARSVNAAPEQLVVGAGTQPLLYLLCGLLPKKQIAMDKNSFPQAERVFADSGFSVVHIPTNENGICMKALYESGVSQVLVSPSNPVENSTALPLGRRTELLNWAKETDGILIEDDYNGELRYNARPIPSMQGSGGTAHVVYLGSFSKLLLPSVRIGYMALPPALLHIYHKRSKSYNQTASKIEQLALAGYIADGQLERHLRRLRKLYASKSLVLLDCLNKSFGNHARVTLRETSLCVLLTLDIPQKAAALAVKAEENGIRISFLPQSLDTVSPTIRLSFAGIPFQDIPEGVKSLKRIWQPYFDKVFEK